MPQDGTPILGALYDPFTNFALLLHICPVFDALHRLPSRHFPIIIFPHISFPSVSPNFPLNFFPLWLPPRTLSFSLVRVSVDPLHRTVITLLAFYNAVSLCCTFIFRSLCHFVDALPCGLTPMTRLRRAFMSLRIIMTTCNGTPLWTTVRTTFAQRYFFFAAADASLR